MDMLHHLKPEQREASVGKMEKKRLMEREGAVLRMMSDWKARVEYIDAYRALLETTDEDLFELEVAMLTGMLNSNPNPDSKLEASMLTEMCVEDKIHYVTTYFFKPDLEGFDKDEEREEHKVRIANLMSSRLWKDYRHGLERMKSHKGEVVHEVLCKTAEDIMSNVLQTV